MRRFSAIFSAFSVFLIGILLQFSLVSCHADSSEIVENVQVQQLSTGDFLVTWDSVQKAEYYTLYRVSSSTGSSDTLTVFSTVNTNSCTIPKKYSGYKFCVSATVDGGESFLSEKFSL